MPLPATFDLMDFIRRTLGEDLGQGGDVTSKATIAEDARFTAEMDDHVYTQRIREHQDSGRRSHVRGTPGFFVQGRIQDVSFGFERLFDAVGSALRR